MSNRRACTVQVIASFSQTARASSTTKPVGVPSGPAKCSGGNSSSVRKRTARPVWGASTRSPRLRGFQKSGTVTVGRTRASWAAACAAASTGCAPLHSARTIAADVSQDGTTVPPALDGGAGAVLLSERGQGNWLTLLLYHVLGPPGERAACRSSARLRRGPPCRRRSPSCSPQGVDGRLLARAAAEAAAAGTDAATALLNAGLMSEATYYRALARALGAPYLDGPIAFGLGLAFPGSLVTGLAPLALGSAAPCVLAPRGRAITDLLDGAGPQRHAGDHQPDPPARGGVRRDPGAVADHAAHDLRRRTPERATAREPAFWWLLILALVLAATLCLCAALPAPLVRALTLAGQCLFLGMTTLRLAALAIPAPVAAEDGTVPPLADADLPVYTVLVRPPPRGGGGARPDPGAGRPRLSGRQARHQAPDRGGRPGDRGGPRPHPPAGPVRRHRGAAGRAAHQAAGAQRRPAARPRHPAHGLRCRGRARSRAAAAGGRPVRAPSRARGLPPGAAGDRQRRRFAARPRLRPRICGAVRRPEPGARPAAGCRSPWAGPRCTCAPGCCRPWAAGTPTT